MSNNLQWTPSPQHDPGLERLRSFTQPLSPVVEAPPESHLNEFAAVIENVIVPRLLISFSHASISMQPRRRKLSSIGVGEFIELALHEEADAAIDFVQQLLDEGNLFQDILLQLMAPAARELGERWVQDSASFVEVALGVARMHRILREFDGVPEHMWSQAGAGRHVLLLPVPGEQHTFGLRLVQEFLLRESWTVSNCPMPEVAGIARLVAGEAFDVVGLSLSGETLIDTLRSAIESVRLNSRNPRIKIIIGGHIFVVRPELVDSLGADAYAPDAASTVTVVNRWAGELMVTA